MQRAGAATTVARRMSTGYHTSAMFLRQASYSQMTARTFSLWLRAVSVRGLTRLLGNLKT
eukprot:4727757-Pleurochrysis_carterae.AAC.2